MNDENRTWLCRRALQAAPYEVCGFILKDGSIIEIPNTFHDPHRGFLMSRSHLVDRVPNPEVIQAIWHTHPGGSLRPSKADVDSMFCGAIDRGWEYHIVTKYDIVTFDANQFAPQDNSFWEAFAR